MAELKTDQDDEVNLDIFIPDAETECSADANSRYITWRDELLIPLLQDNEFMPVTPQTRAPKGTKLAHINALLNEARFTLFPICEAVCGHLHHDFLKSILINSAAVFKVWFLVPPEDVQGHVPEWDILLTAHKYVCNTDAQLKGIVSTLKREVRSPLNTPQCIITRYQTNPLLRSPRQQSAVDSRTESAINAALFREVQLRSSQQKSLHHSTTNSSSRSDVTHLSDTGSVRLRTRSEKSSTKSTKTVVSHSESSDDERYDDTLGVPGGSSNRTSRTDVTDISNSGMRFSGVECDTQFDRSSRRSSIRSDRTDVTQENRIRKGVGGSCFSGAECDTQFDRTSERSSTRSDRTDVTEENRIEKGVVTLALKLAEASSETSNSTSATAFNDMDEDRIDSITYDVMTKKKDSRFQELSITLKDSLKINCDRELCLKEHCVIDDDDVIELARSQQDKDCASVIQSVIPALVLKHRKSTNNLRIQQLIVLANIIDQSPHHNVVEHSFQVLSMLLSQYHHEFDKSIEREIEGLSKVLNSNFLGAIVRKTSIAAAALRAMMWFYLTLLNQESHSFLTKLALTPIQNSVRDLCKKLDFTHGKGLTEARLVDKLCTYLTMIKHKEHIVGQSLRQKRGSKFGPCEMIDLLSSGWRMFLLDETYREDKFQDFIQQRFLPKCKKDRKYESTCDYMMLMLIICVESACKSTNVDRVKETCSCIESMYNSFCGLFPLQKACAESIMLPLCFVLHAKSPVKTDLTELSNLVGLVERDLLQLQVNISLDPFTTSRFGKRSVHRANHSSNSDNTLLITINLSQSYHTNRHEYDILKKLQKETKSSHLPKLMAYFNEAQAMNYHILKFETTPICLVQRLNDKLFHTDSNQRKLRHRLVYCQGIGKAIGACHEKGILIRKIHAASFCVVKGSSGSVVKLFDFQCAQYASEEEHTSHSGKKLLFVELPIMWMDMNNILRHKFSVETDIHSFLMTMLEVFAFGLHPYSELLEVPLPDRLFEIYESKILPMRSCSTPMPYYQVIINAITKKEYQLRTIMSLLEEYLAKEVQQHDLWKEGTSELEKMRNALRRQSQQSDLPEMGIPPELDGLHDLDKGTSGSKSKEVETSFQKGLKEVKAKVTNNDCLRIHDACKFDGKTGELRGCMVRGSTTKEELAYIYAITSKGNAHIAFVSSVIRDAILCDQHRTCLMHIGTSAHNIVEYICAKSSKTNEKDKHSSTQRIAWYIQIIDGLKFLHDAHILHCSLTTEAVYVISNDETIKIGNLNRAVQARRTVHNTKFEEMIAFPYEEIPKDILHRAPTEMISGYELGKGTVNAGPACCYSDIYMAGMLIWELENICAKGCDPNLSFAERVPFGGSNIAQVINMKKKGFVPQKPDFCTDKLFKKLKKMAVNPPCLRPTTSELMTSFKEQQDELPYRLEDQPTEIAFYAMGAKPKQMNRLSTMFAKVRSKSKAKSDTQTGTKSRINQEATLGAEYTCLDIPETDNRTSPMQTGRYHGDPLVYENVFDDRRTQNPYENATDVKPRYVKWQSSIQDDVKVKVRKSSDVHFSDEALSNEQSMYANTTIDQLPLNGNDIYTRSTSKVSLTSIKTTNNDTKEEKTMLSESMKNKENEEGAQLPLDTSILDKGLIPDSTDKSSDLVNSELTQMPNVVAELRDTTKDQLPLNGNDIYTRSTSKVSLTSIKTTNNDTKEEKTMLSESMNGKKNEGDAQQPLDTTILDKGLIRDQAGKSLDLVHSEPTQMPNVVAELRDGSDPNVLDEKKTCEEQNHPLVLAKTMPNISADEKKENNPLDSGQYLTIATLTSDSKLDVGNNNTSSKKTHSQTLKASLSLTNDSRPKLKLPRSEHREGIEILHKNFLLPNKAYVDTSLEAPAALSFKHVQNVYTDYITEPLPVHSGSEEVKPCKDEEVTKL